MLWWCISVFPTKLFIAIGTTISTVWINRINEWIKTHANMRHSQAIPPHQKKRNYIYIMSWKRDGKLSNQLISQNGLNFSQTLTQFYGSFLLYLEVNKFNYPFLNAFYCHFFVHNIENKKKLELLMYAGYVFNISHFSFFIFHFGISFHLPQFTSKHCQ